MPVEEKTTFNPNLIPDSKINSKWINNSNLKGKAMKLLEENMRKIL